MSKGIRVVVSKDTVMMLVLMSIAVAFQLLLREYGYHRDEMYYVAIGDGWTWSNLDMLPLSPLYLRFFTFLFGHSITVIHFASALCYAGTVGVACLMTREFGGKTYAILLTGICMLFSGLAVFGSLFTYESPGLLIWSVALYGIVRTLNGDEPRWLVLTGIMIGIGMLNKVSILFLPFAFLVALLFVSHRSLFGSRWLWISGFMVIPFVIPFVLWQFRNGWYFLNFAAAYTNHMVYKASFPAFLWNQVLGNNIFASPVWVGGLLLFLFSSRWKACRLLGVCYLVLLLVFYLLHMPFYFLMPLYAPLTAAGAVWTEQRLKRSEHSRPAMKLIAAAIPIGYLACSLLFLPLAAPILPVEQLVSYAGALGVNAGIKTNSNDEGILPQHFADRFGWDEMVKTISDVYRSSPHAEQGEIGIMTGNWGEASAVHMYRSRYGLPEPISTDGWFYFKALRTHEFTTAYVSFGVPVNRLREMFSVVEQKGIFTNPYCMPHENNRPVYFCSRPRSDLGRRWRVEKRMDPRFKEYIDTAGVIRAIDFYHNLKAHDPGTVLFTESQINALGYDYMHKGMIDEAIALFALNVEEHPESANVYDSLGEAYLAVGDYTRAVRFYKESLERDSSNTNAREYLKRLEHQTGKGH